MPTATSADQLRGLADGVAVTIGNVEWEKQGDLLVRDNAGQRFEVPISMVGALVTSIVIPDEALQEAVGAVGETLLTVQEERPVRTTTVIQGLDPERVETALHDYLSDQSGLTSGERSGIVEILRDLDLRLPTVTANVTIRVEGTTDVNISDTLLEQDLIGGGIETVNSNYDLTVDWTRTWEREFDTDSGCACDNVDTAYVESLVSDEGIEGNVDDWSVSCNAGSCLND